MSDSVTCDQLQAETRQFKDWIPLCRLTLADIADHGGFPGLAVVYALRDSTTGDILKYGYSSDLRGRIFGNYIGGAGGSTTQRIHTELFGRKMIGSVEISWIVMESPELANCYEKRFRAQYKERVGRLPLWDRIN